MKSKHFETFGAALIFVAAACGAASAQQQSTDNRQRPNAPAKTQGRASRDSDVYVISAKAGGVSLVSGAVRVRRAATGTTQILAKRDELNDGDRVTTDAASKTEILLNPGSFLRLDENTDLEFVSTDLESLRLKLVRGTALVEAAAVGDAGADVIIETASAKIRLEKSGVYRVNVTDLQTEVLVWKGAATIGDQLIKAGRKAVALDKNAVAVAKFDKSDTRDAFDAWSKDRAKELAKLNERLDRRPLAAAFGGFNRSFDPLGFGYRFNSGYWIYSNLTGAYCFVPFGNNYWGSPYGFWYNRGIWWNHNYQPIIVTPQPPMAVKPRDIEPPTVRFPSRGGGLIGTPSSSSEPTRGLPRQVPGGGGGAKPQ